jgi:hypothetical protein
VSVVCCQVEVSATSWGVLPTVVRRCVWSRNLVNEEAQAQWGLLCQKKKKIVYVSCLFWLLQPAKCLEQQQESELPVLSVKFHLQHDAVVCVQGSDMLCLSVTLHVAADDWMGTMTSAPRCVTLTEPWKQKTSGRNWKPPSINYNMPRGLVNLLLPLS